MVFSSSGRRINSCVEVKLCLKLLNYGNFKSVYLDLPYILYIHNKLFVIQPHPYD